MQQTTKYQLNLIESTDTFSPAPLNENAQKLENAIAAGDQAEAAARAAGDATLDQRVTALEVHKFVAGSAPGSSTIELGARPKAVIYTGGGGTVLTTEHFKNSYLQFTDSGFRSLLTSQLDYIAFF